ncbi:contactin-associated protein 1 [Bombina bombina]|uniref:contactin-associated protein 1 n=1 Tax=Bombina bombina TaxID=8345 RepID=UPI00235A9A5A|nr:contactin-associated protein 1 [Bombina bombina]
MLNLGKRLIVTLLLTCAGILQGGHLSFAEWCYNDLISPLYFTSFDASSRYSILYSANFARLYGSSGWSPAPGDKQPWLQIDLKQKYKIMGVATQGTYSTYYDWVTKYIMLYGDRPDSWKPFFQQGSNWTFFGNVNTSGVMEHRLYYPIKARYVRFIPVAWNPRGKIGLRVGLFGCPYSHDVLSFDGDDLIAYQFKGKTSRTLKDDISFNFKTLERDGVLMHAEGSQGDYITLELQKTRLIFQMSLGHSPLHPVDSHTYTTLGSLLDDQHWHSIRIERYGRDLNITLDGEIQRIRCKGDFDQLDLDTEIFFAGIIYQEKSITHKQNFRGCLENIHFNGINIADLARRKKSSVKFVGKVRFSCIEMPYVPVSFAGTNNYLMIPGVPANLKMVVSFSFRTWDMVGLLLYTSFAGSMGSLEMALSEGQINVSISQPNTKKLMFAAGYRLNDGFWHSVYLMAQDNSAVVVIDEDEGAAFKIEYKFQLRTGDAYYFGGCPKPAAGSGCYSNQTAFHGCMQMISVDRQPVDFHRMQLGWLGRFSEVMFNVCSIADRCRPNPCEHGGRCYQSWDDFFCICDMTGYKGETCHKSLFKENCDAYRVSGKYSGNYTLDPDGSGPLKPFNVYCDISEERAWTIVQHDRYYSTKVLGSSPNEPFLGELHYWNASWAEVSSLANGSEYCEQRIEFSCFKSRLLNTPAGLPFSFWMGRNNERHFYWGGSGPGIQRCACGLEKNCADPRYFCNCDADHSQWRYDKGLLNFRDHLPVTRVVVGDTNRTDSEARFFVGPLRCYGDRNTWNTVTFTKPVSLIFPTFKPGTSIDISFYFKTTSHSGTFLENTGNRCRNFIRIELNTTTDLAFIYDVGNGHENLTLKSPFPLNDDEWHLVKAEINVKLARLKVDILPWEIRNYPHQSYINITYDRPLYVGSAEYRFKPYIGCLRGLRMNGFTLDLEGKANETLGVKTNCTGFCYNPRIECQNRGRCVERYSHYTCDCNGTGFEGPFCTRAIGAYFEAGTWLRHNILSAGMVAAREFASITRLATLPLFVSNLTREEISFSFSTTVAPAVLIYISSFASDYVAVLLRPEGTLQLNYQLGKSPYIYQLSKKNMTDGNPHKVNITRDYRNLYTQVDYYPMVESQFYLWEDRRFDSPKALYLGRVMETGVIDSEVQKFNTPGFRGCLSDVRFNNITPIRDIFRTPDYAAVITMKGSLVESNCGAMPSQIIPLPPDMDPWYMGTALPYIHDDGLAGIIAFIVIFLFLLAIACLFLVYHYFHRYKGSYLTNEPKAIDAPSGTKSASARKEQTLPQIEEEGAKTE